MQNEDTIKQFALQYAPCHPTSCYHDLACGHRIQVAYNTEHCGANCKVRKRGIPFICADCIASDVRIKMMMESIDLNPPEDTDMSDGNTPSHEDLIQAIVDGKLKEMLAEGRRMCKIDPMFVDAKMQFWNQFLVEEGYDGLEKDVDVVVQDTRYKYNSPAKLKDIWKLREAAQQMMDNDEEADVTFILEAFLASCEDSDHQYQVRAPTEGTSEMNDAMASLTECMNEHHVGLAIEDDATKAVREAFDLCELTGGHL
jgi:hypothetical protein